jgi:hypothetical protein
MATSSDFRACSREVKKADPTIPTGIKSSAQLKKLATSTVSAMACTCPARKRLASTGACQRITNNEAALTAREEASI